ncbi:hypothetical protein CO683_40380 [Bradyrhizobium ottawaense]|nr:hypothetical protein CO683_40380 [Bradyrhizobium ottawaense]
MNNVSFGMSSRSRAAHAEDRTLRRAGGTLSTDETGKERFTMEAAIIRLDISRLVFRDDAVDSQGQVATNDSVGEIYSSAHLAWSASRRARLLTARFGVVDTT